MTVTLLSATHTITAAAYNAKKTPTLERVQLPPAQVVKPAVAAVGATVEAAAALLAYLVIWDSRPFHLRPSRSTLDSAFAFIAVAII
jgi:hypothetical protein